MEIYSIKLTSGEEIVAKTETIEILNHDVVDIYEARSIVMMPTGELRFGPVLFSANKDKAININRSAIAAYSKYVREEFSNAYTQAVSPLSIPKPSILLG
jgi:hypothetical protein